MELCCNELGQLLGANILGNILETTLRCKKCQSVWQVYELEIKDDTPIRNRVST